MDRRPLGEQSQQTQTETQSQALQHHEPPNTTVSIATTSIAPTSTTPSELSNAPAQSSSPPSKIPLRPSKIRKFSPDNHNNPDSNSSSSSLSQAIVPLPENNPKPLSTITTLPTKSKVVQPRAIPLRMVARSLTSDGELELALRHLRGADPLLAPLIDNHPPPTFDTYQSPFLALTRSIIYQQLAPKAGASIYTRFLALCGGEAGVVPEAILALNPQQLRQIGVSARKASYLQDLARKYDNGILSDSAIVNMDDKSLFTMLTMVNGIGSWSVHMFMIFSLHRPDVLPINDLNVRKGVQILYSLDELPRPSQMDHLCEKWKPYRSVAAWYMWRLSELKGAQSSAVAVASSGSLQHRQPGEPQHLQQPQMMDPLNILNIGIKKIIPVRALEETYCFDVQDRPWRTNLGRAPGGNDGRQYNVCVPFMNYQ